MSNYKMGLRSVNKPTVGVSGYQVPYGSYSQQRDTPDLPTRPGSLDAFKRPSLSIGGETRPYWADKGVNHGTTLAPKKNLS